MRRYQDSKRLAYQAEVPVNWCPALGTVLANEEVIDGKSERGGHPVVRMPLRQWMLRITAYAERLLDDLEPRRLARVDQGDAAQLDRPQRRGRGRFRHAGPTTHEAATDIDPRLHHPARHAVRRHLHGAGPGASAGRSDHHRRADGRPSRLTRQRPLARATSNAPRLAKKKTGVFTGAFAINPVNDEKIPIWIADYVLVSYGTGAIMAVPAHDERDFEFAKQFGLPIRTVVQPPDEWLKETGSTLDNLTEAYTDDGDRDQLRPLRRPADGGVQGEDHRLAGRTRHSASAESTTSCATGCSAGSATGASRSRSCTSWTPTGKPTGVDRAADVERAAAVPARAGGLTSRSGKPEPPLGKATDWVNVDARRQTLSPRNQHDAAVGRLVLVLPALHRSAERPGVLRSGQGEILAAGRSVRRRRGACGAAPALLALLAQGAVRSRPRAHAGAVSAAGQPGHDPGRDRISLGVYQNDDGKWVSCGSNTSMTMTHGSRNPGTDESSRAQLDRGRRSRKKGEDFVLKENPTFESTLGPTRCPRAAATSSTPTTSSSEYGADSLRLYEMFMGPLEATKPWSMRGVEGVYRFLSRVWRLIIDDRSRGDEAGRRRAGCAAGQGDAAASCTRRSRR